MFFRLSVFFRSAGFLRFPAGAVRLLRKLSGVFFFAESVFLFAFQRRVGGLEIPENGTVDLHILLFLTAFCLLRGRDIPVKDFYEEPGVDIGNGGEPQQYVE